MVQENPPHLFCFGLGYSALALVDSLLAKGWRVSGTSRSMEKCEHLQTKGITAYLFDDNMPLLHPEEDLQDVTHILISIPPGEEGDVVLKEHGDFLKSHLTKWVGYLSTTGVYGDHQGSWVDETTATNPSNERSKRRTLAEQQWQQTGLPVHIFRLAGIYGKGRNIFSDIRSGKAKRIEKAGQVFCRIHVEDIVQILEHSIAKPNPGAIYNCADDEPEAQERIVAYASELLGVETPPLIPFEEAELTPMAESFYHDCKRVRNDKIKSELGVDLVYPNYREGFVAIYASES